MDDAKTREIKICIPEEIFSMFLPDKTLDHFFRARKEILLGIRSLIDAKIEALEKKEARKKETGKEKKKIKVE